MNSFSLIFFSSLLGVSAFAQDFVPMPVQGRVHVLGKVADGSPALPAAPAVVPRLVVKHSFPAQAREGAVVHEVIDPQLPVIEKPPTSRTMSLEEMEAFRQSPEYQQLREQWEKRKKMRMIMLSATVYDGQRTLLRWWHEGKSFQAWSNVNFLHLGGFGSFERDGQEYVVFMGLGEVDTQKWAQRSAAAGRKWSAPVSPELPIGAEKNPAFSLVGEMPTEKELEPITALHELYLQEHVMLKAAYVSRSKAQVEKDEELRRNPPKPQVPQIYFWRGKRAEAAQTTNETPNDVVK